MMILAGERQPGQQMSPIREQIVARVPDRRNRGHHHCRAWVTHVLSQCFP
jgi:hypothetical protein